MTSVSLLESRLNNSSLAAIATDFASCSPDKTIVDSSVFAPHPLSDAHTNMATAEPSQPTGMTKKAKNRS
jgi:hypothetical protein